MTYYIVYLLGCRLSNACSRSFYSEQAAALHFTGYGLVTYGSPRSTWCLYLACLRTDVLRPRGVYARRIRWIAGVTVHKPSSLKRVTQGALAGLVAGIIASWSANKFHSLWSEVRGEEKHPEVAELSQRGGRPDSAAAKEAASVEGNPPQEDATVKIAAKISNAVLDRPLTTDQKHRGGVAVHYVFGALSGAFYGATVEAFPAVRTMKGLGFGIAVWLVGVEITLPALNLTEPPWQYPFRMHAYSFISHLIYGGVAEQVRRNLR